MNWIQIESGEKLEELIRLSDQKRVLVFMFSSINTLNYIVKYTIEREWNPREMEMQTFLLDPDSENEIAGKLAERYGVNLYSPQAFIIDKGKCIFSAVDGEVDFKTIRDFANCKN